METHADLFHCLHWAAVQEACLKQILLEAHIDAWCTQHDGRRSAGLEEDHGDLLKHHPLCAGM